MSKKMQLNDKKINKVICNGCARVIITDNGIFKEDVVEIQKEWGYFSDKDLEIHSFHICESCYDKITSEFKVPVIRSKKKEVM